MFLRLLEKISPSKPRLKEDLEEALKKLESACAENKAACARVVDVSSATIVLSKDLETETKREIVKKRMESGLHGGQELNLREKHA